MHSIRAYLHDVQELYYPSENSPAALVEFYSVLEGKRLQGSKYDIHIGSQVLDVNNVEIFTGDRVQISYTLSDEEKEEMQIPTEINIEPEQGVVSLEDGCFVITNEDQLFEYVGETFVEEDRYKLEVVGHAYETIEV